MQHCDSTGIDMPEIKKEEQSNPIDKRTTHLNNRCEGYFSEDNNKSVDPVSVRGRRLSYNLSEVKTMEKKMRRLSVPSRDGCYYSKNRELTVEDYRSFTKQTSSSLKTR